MKPKTVKSFLKLCLDIAYADRNDLKGNSNLTDDEYFALGNIRAAVQNELGDNPELLKKYNLKYSNHE